MAKPTPQSRQANRPSARVVALRKGPTIEMVRLTCPDEAQALKIAESFGTAIVDSDGIRDLHELRLAAEGTVVAYEQIVGETWKPFDRPIEQPGQALDRKAAAAQMSAFE